MPREPTVSMKVVTGLLAAAERSGVGRAELMRASRVRSEDLSRCDARFSRALFERLCEAAIDMTGNPAIGLHWAEFMMERRFGAAGDEVELSPTLREAFTLLGRLEQFFTCESSHLLLEADEEACVGLASTVDLPLGVRRVLSELTLAWFLKLLQAVCPPAQLTRVDFAYAAPSYHDRYRSVFGSRVHFGRPLSGIYFARRWLDRPTAHEGVRLEAPPTGHSLQPSCAERVRGLLRAQSPRRLSMPEAARALALGERSLRRRLEAEGTSFKVIEFAVLAEFATQLLRRDQRSIRETASIMGFSDVHAFHRAFKRWTGRPPGSVQSS